MSLVDVIARDVYEGARIDRVSRVARTVATYAGYFGIIAASAVVILTLP